MERYLVQERSSEKKASQGCLPVFCFQLCVFQYMLYVFDFSTVRLMGGVLSYKATYVLKSP